MKGRDVIRLNMFLNEVTINFNVFSLFMENKICNNVNGCLIVIIKTS